MKKIYSMLMMTLLVIALLPMVIAVSFGDGITPDIVTEDFEPLVWHCGHRVAFDDFTEPGRYVDDEDCTTECATDDEIDPEERAECLEDCREKLLERKNNYAFEGEQISWLVLVMDKNGIEKIQDVYVTLGDVQGEENDIEVNCDYLGDIRKGIKDSCNARILEEELDEFDSEVMGYYMCTFTVEGADEITPAGGSMYGEYWVTVEAVDIDGEYGIMAENEYWFFNPIVAVNIEGDLIFDDVRPGTSSYSETLLIGNDADPGSGVRLDMFITGTDFYDSSSSPAMCPYTNQLSLSAFRYYATHGAFSTTADPRSDEEGYVGINYGIGFNDPTPFYDAAEIMQVFEVGPWYHANILTPGDEMAVTFRLDLPEPCNGDFDTGSIFFWGEAI
jgi:hypothetical protein